MRNLRTLQKVSHISEGQRLLINDLVDTSALVLVAEEKSAQRTLQMFNVATAIPVPTVRSIQQAKQGGERKEGKSTITLTSHKINSMRARTRTKTRMTMATKRSLAVNATERRMEQNTNHRLHSPREGRARGGALLLCLLLSVARCYSYTTTSTSGAAYPNKNTHRMQGSGGQPSDRDTTALLYATGNKGRSNSNDKASSTLFRQVQPESTRKRLGVTGTRARTTANTRTRTNTVSVDQNNESVNNLDQARRRKKNPGVVGSYYGNGSALLDHEILTKEEEQNLGQAVQRAKVLREALELVEQDRLLEEELALLQVPKHQKSPDKDTVDYDLRYYFASRAIDGKDDDQEDDDDDDDDDDDEFDYAQLSIYGSQEDDYEEFAKLGLKPARMEQHERQSLLPAAWRDDVYTEKTAANSNHSPPEDQIEKLTDKQVAALSSMAPGGRGELRSILVQGAVARDTLIRRNVRLVVSIAKRWAQQAATSSPDSRSLFYAGGWDRPSLDEAVQEGIMGLATAADRFDPDRGLRFSTYATHWVTNYVRQCFQVASVGMRVPSGFHDARSKFKTLLKRHYDTEGDAPSMDVIAEEMGIKLPRLLLMLRMTKSTLSINAPLRPGSFTRPGQAGGGGGDSVLLQEMLEDRELRPEDRVELSFLRQSLENAMAQELAPHERDIVRLRLGLDDGVTRTIKQVSVACGGSLSLSEIRLAERRAFQKLRSPHALSTYKFLTYLDFAGVDASTMTLR